MRMLTAAEHDALLAAHRALDKLVSVSKAMSLEDQSERPTEAQCLRALAEGEAALHQVEAVAS